jgi:hypothetical protein
MEMKNDNSGSISKWILGLFFIIICATPLNVSASLTGDCNGDGKVSIAELQSAVAMYQGVLAAPYPVCVDVNGNNTVSLSEVQAAMTAYLGIGAPPVIAVPNLVNRPMNEATALIASAGLSQGSISQTYSNTIANGSVISQTPLAGTNVTKGTSVALVISSGVAPVPLTPAFSPAAGTYPDPIMVLITTTPADANIVYTTDGTQPSLSHGTQVTGAAHVVVSATSTIKALAFKTGVGQSTVFSAPYQIQNSDPFETVRLLLVKVLDDDPKTKTTTPLTPAEYGDLRNRLGAVPGVDAADYSGDTLGTFEIKVTNGGVYHWRHITNDYLTEAAALPVAPETLWMQNPTWNSGWTFDTAIQASTTGVYATHFPVASSNPDPDYKADNAVVCRDEGKIAIVDFLWSEAHKDAPGLYLDQFDVNGVMLYNRIIDMAQAACFTVKLFLDDDLNLGNLDQLKDYKIVMFVGHGGKPGPKTTARLGQSLSLVFTPEIYSKDKTAVGGIPYEDAWKQGYITRNVKDEKITWTSLALRDLYQPAPNQLVILNECWGLLPYNVGFDDWTPGVWQWVTTADRIYNLGDALMDAGVKAVFGYITPGVPAATVHNTMMFLRRLFGGYYNQDVPPARFGLSYWPTCMSAQTFFRKPATPEVASYAAKFTDGVIHTMYAVSAAQYLREVCRTDPLTANKQSNMQQFMLSVGTPATGLLNCWDTWWSHDEYPSFLQDALCYRGDEPTTYDATHDAACAVKDARKVTNAILAE